jgi:hypothetical protein
VSVVLQSCPRPQSFNALQLKEDIDQLYRRLRLNDLFSKLEASDDETDHSASPTVPGNTTDPDAYQWIDLLVLSGIRLARRIRNTVSGAVCYVAVGSSIFYIARSLR